MRNGQNKRMRGRNNHRKNHNPMVRVYESNGPDVKIRGNPSHIAEKYIQLARDDGFDDGDDDGQSGGSGDSPYGTREPQPYIPRDAQPFPQQQQHQPQRPQHGNTNAEGDVERLPSFITGGQQPQQNQPHQGQQPNQNGHDNQPDRFPLHRRRRRHRGPRPDIQGGGDGGDEPTARE